MPAPKTYTKAQWDEFARRLDALPEKPPSEQRVTVRDAMSKVRAHINGARAKGYSLEQLIDEAKRAGIDVTGECASLRTPGYEEATNKHPSNVRLTATVRQSEPGCHSLSCAGIGSAERYRITSTDGRRQQQTRIDGHAGRVQFPDHAGSGQSLNANAMETAHHSRGFFAQLKVYSVEQGVYGCTHIGMPAISQCCR
jgi:hypothetical protein